MRPPRGKVHAAHERDRSFLGGTGHAARTLVSPRPVVVFLCGVRRCALRAEGVLETMRPLPIDPVPGVPAFVRGVSIVRGEATPVVDLRALLGAPVEDPPTRLIVVRVADPRPRRVGLLVDEVLGLRTLDEGVAGDLAPLLRDAARDVVEDLARLDGHLLLLLRAGAIVPSEVAMPLQSAEEE